MENFLRANCHFYRDFSPTDKAWFEKMVDTFLDATNFVGQGAEITPEMRATVAGWAVRLLMRLPFGISHYYHLKTVTIHSGNQHGSSTSSEIKDGFFYCHVHLQWDEVEDAIRNHNNGSNSVLHQFARVLDLLDREMDGVPTALLNPRRLDQWNTIVNASYVLDHRKSKKVWDYLGLSRWRDYDKRDTGCVDVSALFAVATEKYFEDTVRFNRIAPDLYRQMNLLYQQHMLERFKGRRWPRLMRFFR